MTSAAATAVAAEAAAIGERFGDPDLFALATHSQGVFLVKQGRAPEGLALMDEAMLAVTAGEVSPIASGLVYCGVILGCQEAYEPRRAQEWTAALTQWCEQQPDMVAFTGRCLTHRAEILCLHGAWRGRARGGAAGRPALRAGQNQSASGEAMYLQGEVHRLRGELGGGRGGLPRGEPAAAASRSRAWPCCGSPRTAASVAAAAIRRALDEAREPPQRARLLPAYVEIMLAVGDTRSGARRAAPSSSGSPTIWTATCWVRWRPTPAARSTSPRATPAPRWSRCGAPRACGSSWRRRTRSRGRGR